MLKDMMPNTELKITKFKYLYITNIHSSIVFLKPPECLIDFTFFLFCLNDYQ